MAEKRITVWVQKFADRANLTLQWIDPATGRRRSKSAETADPDEAKQARADLEYELNHGIHADPSRMTWEAFRELFEAEYVSGGRLNTRRNFAATLDLFERICNPQTLRGVSERTVSLFVAGLRKTPGRAKDSAGMMPSSIKVRLLYPHTALGWAVEQKLLTTVPKFPAVKVPNKAPQPVPAEAFEKMLEKARTHQMRAYLLCGWLAGLRLSEAHALAWEESQESPYLDLGRERIILPAEFVKAVKDQWLPLDPTLKAALLALPRQGRKVFRFADRTGKALDATAVSQRVRALARKAGVRLTMKTLQRGFGCRYAGKVSAHILQRLMRHANIKTTMDYYANIDDAVEQAVLGPQRNASCNTHGHDAAASVPGNDITPCQDSPNSPSAG